MRRVLLSYGRVREPSAPPPIGAALFIFVACVSSAFFAFRAIHTKRVKSIVAVEVPSSPQVQEAGAITAPEHKPHKSPPTTPARARVDIYKTRRMFIRL